jgi:hypothetical protein
MLKKYDPQVENFIDGIDFSYNDPCIFIVYRPGASGDLLASIINTHYLNTGASCFGITENGQVIFRASDHSITGIRHKSMRDDLGNMFTDELLYNISESLSNRNLHYSLIDQMIFRNHMFKKHEIELILDKFPKSKVIQIYIEDNHQKQLINYQANLKNANIKEDNFDFSNLVPNKIEHVQSPRLLSIPYISLFEKQSFEHTYDRIVKFLDLESRLIRFSYIEYYLKCQTKEFRDALKEYKKQF